MVQRDKQPSSIKVMTAEEIMRQAVAEDIMSAMRAMGVLYAALKFRRVDNEAIAAYQNFISIFNMLFNEVRFNILHSHRISKWKDKAEKYDNFFTNPSITPSTDDIINSLKLFNDFNSDLVLAGIYSLIDNKGSGMEEFGDEEGAEG